MTTIRILYSILIGLNLYVGFIWGKVGWWSWFSVAAIFLVAIFWIDLESRG